MVNALAADSNSPPVAMVRLRVPGTAMGSMQIGRLAWVASVTLAKAVPAPLILIPSPKVATVTPLCQLVPLPTIATEVQAPAASVLGLIDVRLRPAFGDTRNPFARLAISVPTTVCTR